MSDDLQRFLVVLSCVAATGCGDSLDTAEVSGRITFGGEPLSGAAVTTQPIAAEGRNPGPGSFGETDGEGRYHLELVQPARVGAVVGEHRVLITPPDGAAAAEHYSASADAWADNPAGNVQRTARQWPRSFHDGSLRLTVPEGGRDDADFDL